MSHHHDVCDYCYRTCCVCEEVKGKIKETVKPKEKVMSQWVQHISGQGEKWRVTKFPMDYDHHEMERADQWRVENDNPGAPSLYHYLPKSEYRPCPAPERWEDVTKDCYVEGARLVHREGSVDTYVDTAQWAGIGKYRLTMDTDKGIRVQKLVRS